MPLYPLPRNLKVVFFFDSAITVLWFCCLARFTILLPLVGRRFLPGGIADFFQVISILPLVAWVLVRVLSTRSVSVKDAWSLANAVRVPLICYGVIFPHPKVAKHTSYSLIVSAWSIQYFVHFAYHAFRVKTRRSPHFLMWAQYHNFFVTFPLAFTGELVLVFLSLGFSEGEWYDVLLKALFLAYVPVGYFAWSYLISRKHEKYDTVMEKRARGRTAQPERTS